MKLKIKTKLKKNNLRNNLFFLTAQNCHSDCIYDGMEGSTCCTL